MGEDITLEKLNGYLRTNPLLLEAFMQTRQVQNFLLNTDDTKILESSRKNPNLQGDKLSQRLARIQGYGELNKEGGLGKIPEFDPERPASTEYYYRSPALTMTNAVELPDGLKEYESILNHSGLLEMFLQQRFVHAFLTKTSLDNILDALALNPNIQATDLSRRFAALGLDLDEAETAADKTRNTPKHIEKGWFQDLISDPIKLVIAGAISLIGAAIVFEPGRENRKKMFFPNPEEPPAHKNTMDGPPPVAPPLWNGPNPVPRLSKEDVDRTIRWKERVQEFDKGKQVGQNLPTQLHR